MERTNSIEQYLKLYRENEDTFGKMSSEVWKGLRYKAYEYLLNHRLPDYGDEGYEKTSLNEMFAPDLGVNINNVDLIEDRTRQGCGVESFSSIKITVHNDIPVRIELPKGLNTLPEGLEIKSFSQLNESEERDVAVSLSNLLDDSKLNAAQALNILLGINGIYIHVGKGCELKVPIQIINYSGAGVQLLANRKVFIKTESQSKASVICCDHSIDAGEGHVVSNVITCLQAEEDSHVEYLEMEETVAGNNRFSSFHLNQKRFSKISIGSLTLMSGTTRNNFVARMEGENGELLINGLVIGKNGSRTDNCAWLTHAADGCRSDQLFKYALYDSSHGAFEGRITVDKNCRFNEAYQNNKNVLLSADARMWAKPQLLIFNDDVKCGHGATTGQLDPNAIYYMQTRGIPKEEARSMLIQAFMNDVVDRLNFPGLGERLKHLVERRLKGEDILCGTCKLKD